MHIHEPRVPNSALSSKAPADLAWRLVHDQPEMTSGLPAYAKQGHQAAGDPVPSLVFPKPQRAPWEAARLGPYRDQMTEVWLVAGAQQPWGSATIMSPKTAASTLRLAQSEIPDTCSIFKNRERFSTYFKLWKN